MTNPQINFETDPKIQGPTFDEGEWLVIKGDTNTQIITAALWHGKSLVIVGQSDSNELHIRVKRAFESLKGPCRLNIHWYDGAWNSIEPNFTVT